MKSKYEIPKSFYDIALHEPKKNYNYATLSKNMFDNDKSNKIEKLTLEERLLNAAETKKGDELKFYQELVFFETNIIID